MSLDRRDVLIGSVARIAPCARRNSPCSTGARRLRTTTKPHENAPQLRGDVTPDRARPSRVSGGARIYDLDRSSVVGRACLNGPINETAWWGNTRVEDTGRRANGSASKAAACNGPVIAHLSARR